MLKAKGISLRKMYKSEKWSTREKTFQYRGLIKLHARDKKLEGLNESKLRKRVSRNLKKLKSDVNQYRKILGDVVHGDKRLLRTVLQSQKDFQALLQDAEPPAAYGIVFQDYNAKRKELDKLLFRKAKKKKEFCKIRAQHRTLNEKLEQVEAIEPLEVDYQRREQKLMSECQVALAKTRAAKSVGDSYQKILHLLKKDAIFFESILNEVKGEQRDQCRMIYKTTVMGQLASETLDDIREKYKEMAQDVWVKMKEREKSLEVTRVRARDVWEYAKSLVRIESQTKIANTTSLTIEEKRLRNQIKRLEDIFNSMKESMLVRSYEELFVRLQEQMLQRERLSELRDRTTKERDCALTKKNHGELILQRLEHSVVSTTTKYKADKHSMREKIREQQDRKIECDGLAKSRGQLLMSVRAALQNISSMLACVKPVKATGKLKDRRKTRRPKEEEEEKAEDEDPEEKDRCHDVEDEGLAVLAQVMHKATALFSQTNYRLDTAKEERANDLYQSYIADYRSKCTFGDEEQEPSGMHFEHEVVDANVLTRNDIKLKSKHVVEINTKLDD